MHPLQLILIIRLSISGFEKNMTYKPELFFRLISLLFFLVLVYPGLASVLTSQDASLEKRSLAKFPDLPTDTKSLRKFSSRFDQYMRDHMGARNWLVKQYSKVLLSLNTPPQDTLILGKKDWLFYANERTIQDYQNTELFTEKQLKIWGDSLIVRQKALAKKGIDYLFVIAPNKHTIYSEYLPDHIVKKHERSRLDQLTEYLKKHTEVNFLDLRPALLEAKKHNLLYWKKDTHWNRIGAAIAQKALAHKLNKMGYPVKVVASDFDQWTHRHKRKMDLAGFLGGAIKNEAYGPSYDEKDLPCIKRQNKSLKWRKKHRLKTNVQVSICSSQQKNLVMFRDSFSIEMLPFISHFFYKATYIWGLPSKDMFKYFVRSDTDIVIEERAERKLRKMPYPNKWTMNLDASI